MSAAKLKNNNLICYNYGMEEGLMMKSSIGLDPSDIGWNFGFKVFGGNYSVFLTVIRRKNRCIH